MEKKFYTFNQNNSGGYFVEDDNHGVAEYVIIEATDSEDAWKKLEAIGDNVSGFWTSCSCCGERWSSWMDDSDGKEVPMIYGTPVEQEKKGMFSNAAFVHYMDGTKKKFDFK